MLAASGIGVGVYFGLFHDSKTDDEPTTGKDSVRDTTDLDETCDKSDDIVINGYIESKFLSTWVELNLFGRYKVRQNSLMSFNFRF